jgi:type VI secretion system secreted protein VgrG
MKRRKIYGLLLYSLLALSLNATTIDLGSASSYSVLAGSTVTNTGPTVVWGDLGVSQGTAITGFPPGIVNGTQHAGDASALAAQTDANTAFYSLGGFAPTLNLTGQDLGGMTLLPGVYRFDSSAQLTGTLTLNLLGNLDSLFIFQIGSTLTTASDSSVVAINGVGGPTCCNVFWQVGSSATLGTDTDFLGNILTLTSITLNTGANISEGRALALNGAVTLNTNNISDAACGSVAPAAVPEPGTLLLLGAGLFGLILLGRRSRSRAETAHT